MMTFSLIWSCWDAEGIGVNKKKFHQKQDSKRAHVQRDSFDIVASFSAKRKHENIIIHKFTKNNDLLWIVNKYGKKLFSQVVFFLLRIENASLFSENGASCTMLRIGNVDWREGIKKRLGKVQEYCVDENPYWAIEQQSAQRRCVPRDMTYNKHQALEMGDI